MEIRINAGGLGNAFAVIQFQSSFTGFLFSEEQVASAFGVVRDSAYRLNGGVGNLEVAVGYLECRILDDENRIAAEEGVRQKIESFLEHTVQTDRQVAQTMEQKREALYGVASWQSMTVTLAPSQKQKAWYENAWDWLYDVGHAIKEKAESAWNWAWDEVTDAWNGVQEAYEEGGLLGAYGQLQWYQFKAWLGWEEYVLRSLKNLVLGPYDEDGHVTLYSFAANIVLSVFDFDLPLDIRDIVYDIQHWGDGDNFALTFGLDLLALLPVIGGLKYFKHLDDVKDGAKQISNVADMLDTGGDIAKDFERGSDIGDTLHDSLKGGENVDDALKQGEHAAEVVDDAKQSAKDLENLETVQDTAKNADTVSDGTDAAHDAGKVAVDSNRVFRKMTPEEIEDLRKATHMNDGTLKKCTISDDGVYNLKCTRQDLLGDVYPGSDPPVRYVQKIVDINGKNIQVVVPEFPHTVDLRMQDLDLEKLGYEKGIEQLLIESGTNQNTILWKHIKQEVDAGNLEYISKFTEEDLSYIRSDDFLKSKKYSKLNYTWHHNEELGRMQLVDKALHLQVKHTGGNSIWSGNT